MKNYITNFLKMTPDQILIIGGGIFFLLIVVVLVIMSFSNKENMKNTNDDN